MQHMRSMTQAVVLEVQGVAAVTGDGESTTGVDVGAYDGTALVLFHSALASAGTNPTLDVKVMHCDTTDGTYTDITGATFTQVTGAAGAGPQIKPIDLSAAKEFIKVYFNIGGTASPSFTCGVSLLAFPKGS